MQAMHNPLGMKRAAFVSSEDPDVIRAVQNLTDFGTPGARTLRPCLDLNVIPKALWECSRNAAVDRAVQKLTGRAVQGARQSY